MIEINTPGVDIDKIKACIREEVEQYQRKSGEEKDPAPDFCRLGSTPVENISFDDDVSKEDLLKLHGEDFLNQAYISILHRTPDFQGKSAYLDKLQNGELAKIEILGRLRYSKEGRLKNVHIKNLLLPFLIKTLFRIPLFGTGLRIIAAILNFPIILKNIQRIENTAIAKYRLIEEKERKAQALSLKLNEEIEKLKADFIQTRSELADEHSAVKSELFRQIRDNKVMLLDMQRRLNVFFEEAGQKLPKSISSEPVSNDTPANMMVKDENFLFDSMYLSFEERFRGKEEDIKERMKIYLPYVQEICKKSKDTTVLDVGSGRGEWLGLLKENQIAATGVDLNTMMVEKCCSAGLDVVRSDALAFLRTIESDTLSVITGFHIVEHLPVNTMISLLDESFRVLKPGGMVIFETPNPENIIVGACDFYTDPSHKSPIPPSTLSYMIEARGFINIETLRLHPDDSIRIEDPFLSYWFTIGKDYAVIGYKE